MTKNRCSIEGCERPVQSRGWCSMHYQRWQRTGGTIARYYPDSSTSFDERFWLKVQMGSPDDCWLWTAGCDTGGYGQIGDGPKVLSAHRVAWRLTFGDPGRWHVLHTCDNPPCCNPFHLFLGTQLTNMQDCAAKGRSRGRYSRREPVATD